MEHANTARELAVLSVLIYSLDFDRFPLPQSMLKCLGQGTNFL
jgi:hypothetical protein